MKTLKFTQHNRKYYNAAAANHIKEYNLSVWPGYVTAVDEYESGVLLQVFCMFRLLFTAEAFMMIPLKKWLERVDGPRENS